MKHHKTDNVCSIEGCVNPLMEGATHPECRQCRGSRWYWDQRTPAQILERRRKLTMYRARLLKFFGGNGKSKG
jgi:hypothetical protein